MSLKDKASKLDFSTMPGVGSSKANAGSARPKTAPGAMMAFANDARSDLLRENDELMTQVARTDEIKSQLHEALQDLSQWDGAKATRLLDPLQVVRSKFANRHELNFGGLEFAQLKREILEANGNVQPIKVRLLPGTQYEARYEIVFGHRRHEACKQLGLQVLAVIDNIDDRTLFVEMDRENRGRKDLSAWEQGLMYKRALDEGLFSSNRRLAEAVGVDLGAVGKAIDLASLDKTLVAAFASPLDLQFRWAKPLREAWSADPQGVKGRAVEVAKRNPRLSSKEVFEALTSPVGQGVERFNPPTPFKIKLSGKVVATLTSGLNGAAMIAIEPGVIAASHHRNLARTIEAHLSGINSSSTVVTRTE